MIGAARLNNMMEQDRPCPQGKQGRFVYAFSQMASMMALKVALGRMAWLVLTASER